MNNYAQRVLISDTKSSFRPVTIGEPHGLMLVPILFNIFINVLKAVMDGYVFFRKDTQYFANSLQNFIDAMIFQVKTHRDLARSHMKAGTDGDETATSQFLFTL